MAPEPAILLDVSRLISRLGQGPATGIDRVEAEWLAHMQTRPHLLLCRTGAGQLLLPPAAGVAILGWIAGRGLEALPAPGLMDRLRGRRDLRARAGAALRRMALARTGRDGHGLLRHLRRHLPGPVADGVYVNVGHANLRPVLWQNLRGLRRVVLIHDTIPLDHPEFTRAGQSEKFRARFAAALSHAELVLTVSAATRADVLRWRERLGLPARARVEPVPLGTRLAAPGAAPAGVPLDRPFFVTLGTIEPRKNHAALLDAWQELARRLPPERLPRLYIIGRRGWENHAVFARLDALPKDGPVRELAGLDDGALLGRHIGNVELNLLDRTIGANHVSGDVLQVAVERGADTRHKDVVAHLKVGLGLHLEGHHAPVHHVGAIALGGVLVDEIGRAHV